MDDVPPARPGTRHGQRPTIETVARHAGVSRQTVSNALNTPERLAPATLQRVLDAVAELHYRPNSSARAMRRGAARCVAMRITSVPNGFNGPIFDRFVKELCGETTHRDHDVRLVTASWGNVEVRAYEDLYYGGSIDGVVLTELHLDDPRPALLQAIGVPFVAFGRPWGGSQAYPWVDVDGAEGTEKAVDHCVQRGYRRIAYLGWEHGSSVSDDRMAGWRRALTRHGLPADTAALGPSDAVEIGRRLAEQVLDDPAGVRRSPDLVPALSNGRPGKS
ncbi:LacI family DNA-binding transcriptional regulator [Micromonospora sp. NPDC007230]|uniref:LacI family DNA-binding transcriptional regulator n=1 Tax=Micromonospora sp. NPDC007230 TaxID=3364237 RepID=UPI003697F4C9